MTEDLSGHTLSHKFVLQRRIGVGGMATVYEAINVQIDKRVAIKVLKREYFTHDTLMLRFQREARHAAKMNHPHMVQITDYYVDGDVPFIVMEYLEGCTLSDLQHSLDGPLPWRRVVDMCAQVASALQYAHDQGLLHRDIKPSNVFLLANPAGGGDHVKLLDFGIAKLQQSEAHDNPLTSPSQVPGTPEYMAPEHARGDECEARTDLYSLGVMMYRLLTGRLPFYGATPTETLTQHALRAPTPPSVLVPHIEIPPALEALVLKTLAKRPEDRWDNARTLRDALLAQLDSGHESTQVYESRRSGTQHGSRLDVSAPTWSIHAFEWRERLLARRRVAAAFSGVSLALCTFMFLSLFPMPGVATIAGAGAAPTRDEPLARAPIAPPPPRLMADPPRRQAPPPVASAATPPDPAAGDVIIVDDTTAEAHPTAPSTTVSPTPPTADAPPVASPPVTSPPVDPPPVDPPPRVRPPPSPRRLIESFLKRRRGDFQACSEKLPFGKSVTIAVDLTLEPSTGRALEAAVGPSLRTMSYATCALNVLRGLKYPRFVGEGQLNGLALELKL